MGLDMYLSKKIYIGANYEHNNVKGKINLTKGEENRPARTTNQNLRNHEKITHTHYHYLFNSILLYWSFIQM